jgi:hypothetical protein
MRSEQWASVTVNGVSLLDYCSPDASCGRAWFNCVENVDISHLISEQNGGLVVVEVSSSGVHSGPCDRDGFPLYARMVLRETLSHQERVSVWVVIGGILGGLLFLIVLSWILFVMFVREPHATVYHHEGATQVEANTDLETCVENEDNSDDILYAVVQEPSLMSKLEVERKMATNLSRIVPAEESPDLEMQMQMQREGGEKVALTVGRPAPKGGQAGA